MSIFGSLTTNGIGDTVFSSTDSRRVLRVTVSGTPLPTQEIVSVPYAFVSASATFATTAGNVMGGGIVPVGTILPYASTTTPTGFLLCDGSVKDQSGPSGFPELFATIGTNFNTGGETATQFRLPDPRGRFPLGADNMGGTSANRVTATQADNLGQGSGEENHTLTVAEMPSHAHGVSDPGHSHEIQIFDDNLDRDNRLTQSQGRNPLGKASTQAAGTGIGIVAAGGSGPHNNMPPYQTINYIVKH